MSSRTDRFKNRKKKLKSYQETSHLKVMSNSDSVNKLLSQDIDNSLIEGLSQDNPTYSINVSQIEVKESLELLDKEFTKEKYDVLFESGKEVLIDQLLKPLKLSRADIANNVDRNFKYDRDDYTKSSKQLGGKNDAFNTVRDRTKANAINEDGQIQDANTGLWHDASEMDLDHNKPAYFTLFFHPFHSQPSTFLSLKQACKIVA